MKDTKNKYPEGWDDDQIKKIIAHYENQSEEEAEAEDEAAMGQPNTVMEVPKNLAR